MNSIFDVQPILCPPNHVLRIPVNQLLLFCELSTKYDQNLIYFPNLVSLAVLINKTVVRSPLIFNSSHIFGLILVNVT